MMTARVPFLDLTGQYRDLEPQITQALQRVCQSGRFVLGDDVQQFEGEFAEYCGSKHCVAVNSGTSALHLALKCLNIGSGDEVVTTAMSFVATAWAISYVGATPVFVDIDPTTRTMDPAQLESAITDRTKVIIPVHLYGMPSDMAAIADIANRHRVSIVEDAAQAHGATYLGRRVGAIGKIGCFSFYPGKNLGAYGEGGALVTDDERLATRARALRDHGQTQRYHHEEIGFNFRMDAMQGAVLRIKLRHLDEWNDARRQRARWYGEMLSDVTGLQLPPEMPDRESVYHLFVVETDERDALQAHLSQQDIDSGLHYPIPIHLQRAYAHLGLGRGSFPIAERLAARCLSLPMFPELAREQLARVGTAVQAHFAAPLVMAS